MSIYTGNVKQNKAAKSARRTKWRSADTFDLAGDLIVCHILFVFCNSFLKWAGFSEGEAERFAVQHRYLEKGNFLDIKHIQDSTVDELDKAVAVFHITAEGFNVHIGQTLFTVEKMEADFTFRIRPRAHDLIFFQIKGVGAVSEFQLFDLIIFDGKKLAYHIGKLIHMDWFVQKKNIVRELC